MAGFIKRVSSGEVLRIPAIAYNAFADAAEAHARSAATGAPVIGSAASGLIPIRLKVEAEPADPAKPKYAVFDGDTGRRLYANTDPGAAPHLWRREKLLPTSVPDVVAHATFGFARFTEGKILIVWTNEMIRPVAPFIAGIFDVRADAAPNRWLYAWIELHKVNDGFTWATLLNGRNSIGPTGSFEFPARNMAEVHNQVSDPILSNGVDSRNLPGTFALKPVQPNTVVVMHAIRRGTSGVEYWFNPMPMAVDGLCEAP